MGTVRRSRTYFKWIFILFLAGFGIITFIIYRVYNQPARSVENETAIPVTAEALVNAFENNEQEANSKYLNKPLRVTGTVMNITRNQSNMTVLQLQGSDLATVLCSLEKEAPQPEIGKRITVTGFCTGFLSDVVMDRCIY